MSFVHACLVFNTLASGNLSFTTHTAKCENPQNARYKTRLADWGDASHSRPYRITDIPIMGPRDYLFIPGNARTNDLLNMFIELSREDVDRYPDGHIATLRSPDNWVSMRLVSRSDGYFYLTIGEHDEIAYTRSIPKHATIFDPTVYHLSFGLYKEIDPHSYTYHGRVYMNLNRNTTEIPDLVFPLYMASPMDTYIGYDCGNRERSLVRNIRRLSGEIGTPYYIVHN